MNRVLHTPYDGSARLFQIGMKPLDPADWIEVDDRLGAYLDEKERLAGLYPDAVLAAEPGTAAAQAELLALLAAHLVARHPDRYRREGDAIGIVPAGRVVGLDAPGLPPLGIAARLVQEDLLLLRKDGPAWRLVAGALSFPSSWSLREKLGRPLHEVHGPVPGFGPQTRNAMMIERMFDHMRPEMPAIRWNWSIYGDDALFHPESADPRRRRFGAGARAENVFMRVERQTLRRLPDSGDIVFTVRIHVDPLEALERQADAHAIAAALIGQLNALDAAQLAYKGLTAERGRLVARLGEIAER